MAVEWEFQKTIYATLTGNAPLMAVVAGIHDVRPQEEDGGSVAGYPYVTMGKAIIANDDTKTELSFDVLLRVHTYSRTGSLKEAKEIQGLIYEALHRNEPSMTGHTVVSLERDDSDVITDDNTSHGICEYRALIQKD